MNVVTKLRAAQPADQIRHFLGVPLPDDFQVNEGEDVQLLTKEKMEVLMLERAPFFFIDRAIAIGNHTVWAIAPMTMERCAGHFPKRPIVPLIELCKGMAQSGIILVSLHGKSTQAPIAISSGPSKAMAKDLISAPADVLIKVELDQARMKLFFVNGTAYIDGIKVGTLDKIIYTLINREEVG